MDSNLSLSARTFDFLGRFEQLPDFRYRSYLLNVRLVSQLIIRRLDHLLSRVLLTLGGSAPSPQSHFSRLPRGFSIWQRQHVLLTDRTELFLTLRYRH